MRDVPDTLLARWRSGDYVGTSRPMFRLTVQRPKMALHPTGDNMFSSFLFSGYGPPKELTNGRSLSWDRSIDSDAASCSISLWNTKPLAIGAQPTTTDLDELGYYTPQRGSSAYSSRWGHVPNEWLGMLVPDNIIRTYEGYGFDAEVCPSEDANLVQTGVWRIDTVSFSHEGTIEISCRDLASILMDQIAFPPVVPFEAGPVTDFFERGKYAYPVQFESVQPAPTINNIPLDPERVPLTFNDTSNTPYISGGSNASYRGHRGSDAFDDDTSSYWLSIGNPRPDQGYSFEWAQGTCAKTSVAEVRFRTRGTGYTAYICIYADGAWVNVGGVVPYDENHPYSAPNGSNTAYVKSVVVSTEGEVVVALDEAIEGVTKVRVTLGNLWNSKLDSPARPWRAGIRDIRAFGGQRTRTVTTQRDLKNYDDYMDIIKLFLAWGGFFWPAGASELICDGSSVQRPFTVADPAMTINGAGRVWGDFKLTGTAGPATLDVSNFDKKPLIECIRYIAEIVGFLFYIDETGGAVCRPPNIYSVGNLMHSLSRTSGQRTPRLPVLDERVVLEQLTSTLSGANLRERVFVANSDGSFGHMAEGWNPNPVGLRRVGGWSDLNFETEAEARVMAEMITIRQLFSYRTDSLTIPGNPQIQVDDQVRVFERTTSEGFVHYVRSISSSNDLESGQWTYSLDTHWLGESPFQRWAFDRDLLSAETRRYLAFIYGSGEEAV